MTVSPSPCYYESQDVVLMATSCSVAPGALGGRHWDVGRICSAGYVAGICRGPGFLAGLVVWILGTPSPYLISTGGHGTVSPSVSHSAAQHEVSLIQIPMVSLPRTERRVLVLLLSFLTWAVGVFIIGNISCPCGRSKRHGDFHRFL